MGNDETDGGVADNLDGGSTGDATAKMDASAPAQPLLVERTSFPIPGCGYRAVGYGLDAPGGQVGKRLSIPFCITNTQANRYIADGNTSGTCVGDSGGPLYLEGTNIVVATLSGIAFKTSGTTDPNGCGANYYSLYSPIEAQLPWIMTALASVPELK